MISTSFLTGKAVAVMGLGKSGLAAVRALTASDALVWAWDDNPAARAAAEGAPLVDLAAADFSLLSLLVWSPGIPHTLPRPHPVAEKARAAGIPMICDIDLLAQARPQSHFLGITGTNGKSTTTTLLAHILSHAGIPVAAGGNLGTPALALPELDDDGRYVLELSSYQLELVPSLELEAAVLLNITPDHLDRHGGMSGYVAAKAMILDCLPMGAPAVIGIDDEPCALLADQLDASDHPALRVSVWRPLKTGISAPDGVLMENGRTIVDLNPMTRLPGRHNWQNACAAFAMARLQGIEPEVIATGLASYPGLAHRQELVAVIDGVTYINDSKATNADAAEKALACYDRILWIIGGQMKEGGIASLEPHFHRIAHAFLIGEATPEFARTLKDKVAFTPCNTLDIAVACASAMAEPGNVVLLAPACASWDQFKSFEHRGEEFRAMVRQIAARRAP